MAFQIFHTKKNLQSKFLFQGFVAFVVGVPYLAGRNETQVYSPDGHCQHHLAAIPDNRNIHLAFIDDKILACGVWQNVDCYVYNPQFDNWTILTNETIVKAREVYDDKVFMFYDEVSKVFDPATMTWSTWPSQPKKHGGGHCIVQWRDVFFVLGGYNNDHNLFHSFNLTSYEWQEFNRSKAAVYNTACILIPDDKILILGADTAGWGTAVSIYDILSKNWTRLAESAAVRSAASLVSLGSRFFAVGGDRTTLIEEFHTDDYTWSPVDATLISNRNSSRALISVPAELFQHLPGGCVGVE